MFLAYKKVRELLLELESLLKRNGYEFMRSDHYGYLSSRPQELGAPLRVSVNVHLPLTAKVRKAYTIKFQLLKKKMQEPQHWNIIRKLGWLLFVR